MKVWVVVSGDETYSENVGMHQLEDRAYDQANELMATGEWGDGYVHAEDDDRRPGFQRMITWLRDGDDFVSVEEWEVKY